MNFPCNEIFIVAECVSMAHPVPHINIKKQQLSHMDMFTQHTITLQEVGILNRHVFREPEISAI